MEVRIKHITPSLVLSFILSGCNTHPPLPDFNNAPKPPINSEVATIYVIRFGPYGGNSSNSVKVNEKELVALAPGYYTWLQLPPGNYKLTESSPWHQTDISGINKNSSSLSIQVEKGKTYYFGFSESLETSSYGMEIMIVGNTPIVYQDSTGKYKRDWVSGSEKEGKEAISYMGYTPSQGN